MHRGLPVRSLAFALAASVSLVAAASAQTLAPATDHPGFEFRRTPPSLRLVTLGGLSLAMQDENNEINLWDFAGSALGLESDRDSTSMDVYLDSGSLTDQHTLGARDYELRRLGQNLLGFEAVGRARGKFAAALDAAYLGTDVREPDQAGVYSQNTASTPVAIPTVNGKLAGGKIGWGGHLSFGRTSGSFDLRNETLNGSTVELDNGELVKEPIPFVPIDGNIKLGGFGIGVGWSGVQGLETAFNWDRTSTTVRAENQDARHVYETEEPRASNEFSFAATERYQWITLGAQVGTRDYSSKETYRFSLSGGLNGPPVVSRGDMLFRDFHQEWLRSRIELAPPAVPKLLVAGDFAVRYDRTIVDPATSPSNYNEFMQSIANDTLGMGLPVLPSKSELRSYNGGVGLGYRFSSRVQVGVEAHRYQNSSDSEELHARQRITDFRGGMEFAITPSWTGRLGGYHRADDADVYTAQNELVTNAFTAGFGWARAKSRYGLDGGIEVGRRSSDYPDPSDLNGSTFRFVLYNRWAF